MRISDWSSDGCSSDLIDPPTVSGPFPGEQGSDNTCDVERRCMIIDDNRSDRSGGTVSPAGMGGKTRHCLQQEILAWSPAIGPRGAEPGRGSIDEARMLPPEIIGIEPEAGHRSWPEILHPDVGRGDQPTHDRLAVPALHVHQTGKT